jgi:hypothetical protein
MEQHLCYCGNPTRFNKKTKKWGKYCSPRCISNSPEVIEKRKKTNLEKYGVENPAKSILSINKMKSTISNKTSEEKKEINLRRQSTVKERYGVENIMQLDSTKESLKNTVFTLYGVDNAAKSTIVQKKIEETNIERYGVKAPAQNIEIKEKVKKTTQERYGYTTILSSPSFKEHYNKESKRIFYESLLSDNRLQGKVKPLFTWKYFLETKREKYQEFNWECLKCGTHFYFYLENGIVPRCPSCYPLLRAGESLMEKEIHTSLSGEFSFETRKLNIIPPYELDIYFPDHNIAIEFNGTYWHSESAKKDKSYHLNKTLLCESKGINLIHIFEWQWVSQKEIILSILYNRLNGSKILRTGARKCKIERISTQIERSFLKENHIQGYIPSKICYGLINKDGEIIQIASFGYSRYNHNYEWELLRSCSKLQNSVQGGLSKLMANFIKENDPVSIISYCDRGLFNGKGYTSSGFTLVEYTSPSYWYTKNHKTVESRFGYQKHKLRDKLDIFDDNLTEWENMQLNGYDRIWNCGNIVFEWKKVIQ